MDNLRFVLFREIPEDDNLRRQWNTLVEHVEKPQVFYTYEWALAVQRAYGSTLRPLLFLAYDQQESLCGVAALASDASGKRVSFLCATTGDYCDFLSVPEHRSDFVGGLFAELRKLGIGEMAFANLPADSATVPAMKQAAARSRYLCFARTAYRCAQVSLGSADQRVEGKSQLPRKKMLRRFLNTMGREAPVRLDHAWSWEAAEPILVQFMQAHVARFLVTGRISNMARPERQVFLTELGKLLSQAGWLNLTRMMTGEKTVAWNYGFQFHGTWFWYQPTFDSDLEKYSPGFCLLAKLIEEAAENAALETVDLGLGAEEYKERFSNQSRETLHVTLKTSAFEYGSEIARYQAATIVKAFPRVETAVRLLAARVQSLKERREQEGAHTLLWPGRLLRDLLWTETEVFFYEWCGPLFPASSGLKLRPLDLNQLATAAMK